MDKASLLTFVSTAILCFGTLSAAIIGTKVHAFMTDYDFTEQAFGKDNSAALVRLSGFIVSLMIATTGAYNPHNSFLLDLAIGFGALAGGAVVLSISLLVTDHLILSRVRNTEAIYGEKKTSVAVVEFATLVATACIYASGMRDATHSIFFNLTWFLIGQAFLICAAHAYAYLAPQVFRCAENGSCASALALGGMLLSAGIAVAAVVRGEFTSWSSDLGMAFASLVVWAALMAFTQLTLRYVFARPQHIGRELVDDNNWGVGLIQGLAPLAVTLAFAFKHVN